MEKIMNATERQSLRLNILKLLCETLHYNLDERLFIKQILELLPNISKEEITSQLLYLQEKGYLNLTTSDTNMGIFISIIKLTAHAIDLIEKIENNMNIDEYLNDFSKDSITSFSNINNSQIIINSPNSQIIIDSNESKLLIEFFSKLIEINNDNKTVKDLSANAIKEINSGTASKDYLKAIGQTLLSIGNSVIANLITPTIAFLLGISLK